MHQDKAIWQHFKTHYADWFPGLGSRSSFVRQCAGLVTVKQQLLALFFAPARRGTLHMQDGVPVPVTHYARSGRDRCFREEAAYGYCAAKDEKYYGFLGHVMINHEGCLSGFLLTPANGSEREALREMAEEITGHVLGDKGFISAPLKEELAQRQVYLHTPLRENMEDARPAAFVEWVVSTRRLVETVISQLTERFHMNEIRVKDSWHLQSRIARKLLAHAIATTLAKLNGLRPTQLAKLVTL